jgi:sulfate adenylyltransferase subunit 1
LILDLVFFLCLLSTFCAFCVTYFEFKYHQATMSNQALKFITCGSVDDGKSTLIGRLLVDSKTALLDQIAGVSKTGEIDLAQFTDGLTAEREQGITIDVAYRYFSTASRKFIIGDAPGHEQYTRNMVTAASSADAAVVLVDATKLSWQEKNVPLLPQTKRHSLLAHLLRVPNILFAVNKLDAVSDAELAFKNISASLQSMAEQAGIQITAIVPVSALKGNNVVEASSRWPFYTGHSLLQILEQLPAGSNDQDRQVPTALPVQWLDKDASSSTTAQGRRTFWGRLACGALKVGQELQVFPSGQTAKIVQLLDHAREPLAQDNGLNTSYGIVLDREVDISRGDWLLAPNAITPSQLITATVAWMDEEPLQAGRTYLALHGHRWVKAKVQRIVQRFDIHSLASQEANCLQANEIGLVELALQQPIAALPYAQSKQLGALILVDTATHKTSGAVLVR